MRLRYRECPKCIGAMGKPFLCDGGDSCPVKDLEGWSHPLLVAAHRKCVDCGFCRTDTAVEAPDTKLPE